MTVLRGSAVTLRPFRADELDRLVEVARGDLDEYGPRGGPRDADGLRDRIAISGSWSNGMLVLAIEAAGRLVGEVQARNMRGAMPPGVFELGVEVYEASDRGRGFGSAAIAEISSWLFANEQAIRVQLTTDLANAAMRRVAERLGFGYEGTLRGFMPTAAGPRDYAIYGLTRLDWLEKKGGWIRTS